MAQDLLKDEATNPSGSFKDRRASHKCFHGLRSLDTKESSLQRAATMGGRRISVDEESPKCIVVQECYDNRERSA